MQTIRQVIGDRVRDLRKSLGMTQEAFGKVAGVKRVSVTNIEKGKQLLTFESLLLICHYAGTTPSKFLEGLTLEQFLPPESIKFIESNHPELKAQFVSLIFQNKFK